ncbi:RagB/SusD family nutrient uptake outer membrane protein [Kaistella sp.]|uniref:RagB/SusD family nutrient uptake outer membrane protein n=1 Tax=Kaistella sp. TaxID=2782235 RepID=UPI002F921C2A
MKKNIITKLGLVLSLSVVGLTSTSCSRDEIIDLKPFNSIDENLAFSTAANVDLAVIGVYNAAQNGFYYTAPGAANTPRGYAFGAAYTEQGDMRGEDMVNTATFYQLTYTATYDAGTANNVHHWENLYGLINKANIVIEGANKAAAGGVITPAVKDAYLGEMYFFRALAHLEALKHFARPYNFTSGATHPGVPYRDFAITSPATVDQALAVGRGTVAEAYSKILADLNNAEALAPSKSTRTGNAKITRINKEAAIALKVRVYLNMRNWNSVLTEGAKLATAYSLPADPTASSGAKFTNKYKDVTNLSDATPIIRYAEVLLSMAEANARLGSNATAVAQLNQVRNRALTAPATEAYTEASFANTADLVEAIVTERRIEFLAEGMRWNDIHRLMYDDLVPTPGIPAKVANAMPTGAMFTLGTPYTGPYGVPMIPKEDFKVLWPIPLSTTVNNPKMQAEQNPGW